MADADKPAAPVTQATEAFIQTVRGDEGLSKREVAAIAAMQGLLANPNRYHHLDEVARLAAGQADALFAALANGASK